MNKEKINQYKEIFLKRQADIMNSHASKGAEIDVGEDDIDRVQSNILKNTMDKLCLRDKETLIKIKAALQKIIDGTFGSCEECGEAISEKRLAAIPYVSMCVSCAEQKEREAKQYRA